jgi:type IV pilus assembly protein PilV
MRLENRAKNKSSQRGFSMLEVMVTLAVLSVGLLGMAALQTTGVRFNHQSYMKTQAVFQAYDLLDRIRANKACLLQTAAACPYDNVTLGFTPAVPGTICGAAACSTTQMATYDVYQWKQATVRLLANGQGAVCRGTLDAALTCTPSAITANDTSFTVAITWVENEMNMRIDVQSEI